MMCGFSWPLLDPNDEDRANLTTHTCRLDDAHALPHRCHCGDEHPGPPEREVWPEAMHWTPPEPWDDKYQTFCIYCQKEYGTFAKLKAHLRRVHPDTYAQVALAPKEDDA